MTDGTYHGQAHPSDPTLLWSSFGTNDSIVGWAQSRGAWVTTADFAVIASRLGLVVQKNQGDHSAR